MKILALLFFTLIHAFLLAGEPNLEMIKSGLHEFNELKDEDKKTQLDNEGTKLPQNVLEYHFTKLDDAEQKECLKNQLNGKYPSLSEQQAFLIEMQKSQLNYDELINNLSKEDCKSLMKAADPEYYGVLPIMDWLNSVNIASFFNPTLKNALLNREHFNDFNSFDQFGLWIEPFGSSAKFQRKVRDGQSFPNFDLYTVGLGVGLDYSLMERLVFTWGMGYFYSNLNRKNANWKAEDHAFYFGPSLGYLFKNGYLSCMFFGIANFYHVSRNTHLFPNKIELLKAANNSYQSWDGGFRIDGGFSLYLGKDCYLYPYGTFDYLYVFELSSLEELEDKVHLNIKSHQEAFCRTKIGIKFTREIFKNTFGYFIPSIFMGYINYLPLSTKSYSFSIRECDGGRGQVTIQPWNQYYIGTLISIIHRSGINFFIDYETSLANHIFIQKGSMRAVWTW